MNSARGLSLLLGVSLALACGGDRERPAPPQLSISFNLDSVGSKDTLFYTFTAKDPDLIDSMWIVVDSQIPPRGYDGYLLATSVVPDTIHVRGGHIAGQKIVVKYWARDGNGWADTAQTYLTAKGL